MLRLIIIGEDYLMSVLRLKFNIKFGG